MLAEAAPAEARLHPFTDVVLPAAGHAIFEYLTTRDAVEVRAVNRACRDAVAGHRWHDLETHIRRDVRGWRACFPRAASANIGGDIAMLPSKWVVDSAFVHFAGLRELRMARRFNVTYSAFVHLRGNRVLNMQGCSSTAITDAAFAHLRGIHTLNVAKCNQPTITDAAFAHLRGIHTLNMSYCNQDTITDAAFAHLRGIHTLDMSRCNQPTITDAALTHLRGIHTLDMGCCNQPTITDAAFVHLRGVRNISISGCNERTISAATAARQPRFTPRTSTASRVVR
jgi:hypothetical protein